MVELSRYFARLHPAVLTAVLVAAMVVQIVLSGLHVTPLIRAIVTALPIAATCLWCWSIFRVAKACGAPGAGVTWGWLFAVPPIMPIIAALAGWSMQNSPAALAFFIVFFVALWFAAQALENADALNGQASAGQIVVTMFLMFFALLGVWILRPKIERLEARMATSAD